MKEAKKEVKVDLAISPDYSNNFIRINKKTTELSFTLQDGTHTVETDLIEIGRLPFYKNSILQARLSFTYEWDAKEDIITVCGANFCSDDSMCLTTTIKDTSESCYQRACSLTVSNPYEMYNPHWNYTTLQTPGLQEAFIQLVTEATNVLVNTLKEAGFRLVRVKTPVPELSPEEFIQYQVVYKENQLIGFYNPEQTYGENYIILPLQSVWGGEAKFRLNENFANVIGSTHDPQIGGLSWIELWRRQYGTPSVCSSLNYGGFRCNTYLVGGHVIPGRQASRMPAGSNVYIMPICNAHNNNDNVYMAAIIYTQAIWLKNYLGR